MSVISIRRLDATDAGAFKTNALRSLVEHPDAFSVSPAAWDLPMDVMATRLTGTHVFGAIGPDHQLLGHIFLITNIAQFPKYGHKCPINWVYVIPEARRTGAGRALMNHAISTARDHGFEYVKLDVAEHLTAACRLYESCGFETFGVERDFLKLDDGRRVTQRHMQLKL